MRDGTVGALLQRRRTLGEHTLPVVDAGVTLGLLESEKLTVTDPNIAAGPTDVSAPVSNHRSPLPALFDA